MLTSAFNHQLTKYVTWTEGTKENKGLQQVQLEYFQIFNLSKDVIGKLRTGIATRMKHGCGKQNRNRVLITFTFTTTSDTQDREAESFVALSKRESVPKQILLNCYLALLS
jgi:hypothetical protein